MKNTHTDEDKGRCQNEEKLCKSIVQASQDTIVKKHLILSEIEEK